MWIFKKERESLRIKEAKAARAVMVLHEEVQEINITLITEDGERLDLQLTPRVGGQLAMQLAMAYNAIFPPLSLGTRASNWIGMEN